MAFDSSFYDVLIVGYGPVGEALAMALGRQGRRVAVIERWTERYPLPRAVCVDHEMYRMLSQLGMQQDLPKITHAGPAYRWFNAQWRELLSIDWSAESISSGPEVHFIHQPTLENMLDAHVQTYSTVQVHLGYEVKSVSQTDKLATLEIEERASGKLQSISARYVVGCDGANSLVRQAIAGGEREDRGFEADWLVIDILPHENVTLDIPAAAQWCNPERPTTIVPGGVSEGRYYRRWEFMRLPNETIEDLETDEKSWALLAPWVKPEQATLIRRKVYTFRSLLAKRWREGRLLIAGDAAHLMPPFMGQGMCAGLRDDWNLAWKLNLILDNRADERLLDSYQIERYPHISDVIDLSVYLGKVICQPDAAKAAARDEAFFSGTAEPMQPFPCLTQGILQKNNAGEPEGTAGLLSPHGRIVHEGKQERLDDVTGGGFVLLSTVTDLIERLSSESVALLKSLPIKFISLSDNQDVDNKMLTFMNLHDVTTLLIRPDYYIYGGAENVEGVDKMLAGFESSLCLIKHSA